MSEYDQRQYQLMLTNVDTRIDNMRALLKTINNLNGLICVLEEKDIDWTTQFMNEWWILEELYAVKDYEGNDSLNNNDLKIINNSLQKIKILINQKV